MRRPHLFTFFSAVSLLLCVAVCVMWARSYLSERLWFKWVPGRLLVVRGGWA